MTSNIKILDCSLRDGGYYTNWDFDKKTVNQYIDILNSLPIDCIELGYRSPLQPDYHGKYFYMPLYELRDIRERTDKKLAIIINEAEVTESHFPDLLEPIKPYVSLIRMAVRPSNFDRATELAKKIKAEGFEVSFNLMYLSEWEMTEDFFAQLEKLNSIIDIFYLVDSFGSTLPEDLEQIIPIIKSRLKCKLGFHGHNNLELSLSNTLTAIKNGVEYVDSTVLGMGRGAGNLKTELLLSVLNKRMGLDVNFNALGSLVSTFLPLKEKYDWGTSLPYMISGANSIPQKEVMEWVTVRYYTLNAIIRALNNKRINKQDNEKFPAATFPKIKNLLLIGGGPSVSHNTMGILKFLENNEDIGIIHASAKNAAFFKHLPNRQFFCLVGNEGRRMEYVLQDLANFNGVCILPPFPRKMGTYVPAVVKDKTYELEKMWFTDKYPDAHTTIALQVALNCEPDNIYFVGYDGYRPDFITTAEVKLIEENQFLFHKLKEFPCKFSSLTPTHYNYLEDNQNLFYKLSK